MHHLGNFSLMAIIVLAAYAIAASLLGVRRGSVKLTKSAERALLACTAFSTAACFSLVWLLMKQRFQLRVRRELLEPRLTLLLQAGVAVGGQRRFAPVLELAHAPVRRHRGGNQPEQETASSCPSWWRHWQPSRSSSLA